MKKHYKNFNEREIDILNEMSDDNIIYEETQSGPQEEPIVQEQVINIKKNKKLD